MRRTRKGYVIALHLAPPPERPRPRLRLREWCEKRLHEYELAAGQRLLENMILEVYGESFLRLDTGERIDPARVELRASTVGTTIRVRR